MSKISRSSQRTLSQLYAERQHLIHPVPTPICFITTGSVLPEAKWHKFCKTFPNSKLNGYCVRKRNGSMQFNGEYGLDVAALLQIKYPELPGIA